MSRKFTFVLVLAIILSACAPTPATQTSEVSETSEVLPATATATLTPDAPTPSPTPEAATVESVIRNEMKGKAPQVADASMGTYQFMRAENGAYRVVNEKLGLDVELSLVADQYGQRMVGDDDRTVFIKNEEGKWVVAPFWRWGEQRIELGIVENSQSTYKGMTEIKIAGELMGYDGSVEIEHEGEKHILPVAVFWVGNDQNGEKILFKTVLGYVNGWVSENAYGGSSLPNDPNAVNNTTPRFATDVSPEMLVEDLEVGGTYVISLMLGGVDVMEDYSAVNTDMVDYLIDENNALNETGLGMVHIVSVPMLRR
ncbi:MAG: hypothetical protein HY867_06740 [Chloroflexi bacterium]|nr:hypothetical protein [Chloroflexota bacterium]